MFGGKKLQNVKCVFWCSLQLPSKIFLILRKIQKDNIMNVNRSSYKVTFSCQILVDLNFIFRFSKNTQISNFMETPPVGAELFHADSRMDGRTDTWRSLQSLFRSSENVPKDLPTCIDDIPLCLCYTINKNSIVKTFRYLCCSQSSVSKFSVVHLTVRMCSTYR